MLQLLNWYSKSTVNKPPIYNYLTDFQILKLKKYLLKGSFIFLETCFAFVLGGSSFIRGSSRQCTASHFLLSLKMNSAHLIQYPAQADCEHGWTIWHHNLDLMNVDWMRPCVTSWAKHLLTLGCTWAKSISWLFKKNLRVINQAFYFLYPDILTSGGGGLEDPGGNVLPRLSQFLKIQRLAFPEAFHMQTNWSWRHTPNHLLTGSLTWATLCQPSSSAFEAWSFNKMNDSVNEWEHARW